MVTSRPPRLARRGTTFSYQVAATTGTGRTTFPAGLEPRGHAGHAGRTDHLAGAAEDLATDEATVMVVVGDDEGHDVFHKFPLSVVRSDPMNDLSDDEHCCGRVSRPVLSR